MAGIGTRKAIKLVDESPALSGNNWEPSSITILRTWAEIKERNTNRVVNDGQAQLGQFFEFRFRYEGDAVSVNANTKLIYDGKKYTVHSIVKEQGNRFYWIVKCQAKTFT